MHSTVTWRRSMTNFELFIHLIVFIFYCYLKGSFSINHRVECDVFSATFYYLLLEEAEKYISAFDKHQILFPRLYSFHISQGRKVLAYDLWSRTVRRLWWLIVLLWDFAVVLTYVSPTVKHINALCLSRDKQLNLLSHKKVINSLSWMGSFRDLSVIPNSIIQGRMSS